jgi:hypothetical protein
MVVDYSASGMSYWKYCTHNTGSSSVLKFLTNAAGMNDGINNGHTWGDVDKTDASNPVFRIGKGNPSDSAAIAQTQFANLNSADKNCFVFESDIMFDIKNTTKVYKDVLDSKNYLYVARLSVLANPENSRDFSAYNSMMPQNDEGGVYFSIDGEFDLEKETWKSFGIGDFTLENGKWYKMVIEYYKAEGVMKLYIDGYLVHTFEGLSKNFVPTAGIVQLQGLAEKSTIAIDNTYVGTVDKTLAD